jgi:hypothetical protein
MKRKSISQLRAEALRRKQNHNSSSSSIDPEEPTEEQEKPEIQDTKLV